MTRIPLRVLASTLAVTTALTGTAGSAFAQIEEIVVTARKREENLQEVPIVITAFTAEMIERKGISDLSDVAKYTNGLILDIGFSRQDTRITVRGLSPTRGRQNVAVLQDDVDISSLALTTAGGSFLINPRLIDVERIEVVKGPHSALYGRSAFNGAINYITKKPGDEPYVNFAADVASHGKMEVRGSVSGPVIPGVLALGLNAGGWKFKGFYDSAVTGADLGGNEGFGAAGAFTLTPSDMLTFTGRIEYSDDHFDPDARTMLQPNLDVPIVSAASTPANNLPAVLTGINATSFPQVVGSLGDIEDFPPPGASRNPRTGLDYPGSDRTILRATLRSEVDLEAVLFTSITHFGDNTSKIFVDQFGIGDHADPAINAIQETFVDTDTRLVSEELRLQSLSDSALQWTFGGLFWNEFVEQSSRQLICMGPSGGCGPIIANTVNFNGGNYNPLNRLKRDTHHWSGFGMVEFDITEQLAVSGEFRYTKEKEDTIGPFGTLPAFLGCAAIGAPGSRAINAAGVVTCGPFGPPTSGPLVLVPATAAQLAALPPQYVLPNAANLYGIAEVETSFWTPRATIEYNASEDLMIYATAALGKKPGGFSTLGTGFSLAEDNVFDPEEMWVYELGTKSEWLDNRLIVNAAIYYQDFSKKQVSVFVIPESTGIPSTKIVNAAKARVKGLEIDVTGAPSDNFTYNVAYTYNDGKYKDFTDLTNSASAISRAGNCTVTVVRAPTAANPNNMANRCLVDYSGRRLEGAAKHTLTVSGSLSGDVSADLSWFVDGDVRYQSKRYTTFENTLEIPSYWNLDMRLGIRGVGWNVTGYVNNVFNDTSLKANAVYIPNWNISFLAPRNNVISGASAQLPDKRQFGVRTSVNF